MDDYFDAYYTNPDELIGSSKDKQNYAMHRQLSLIETEVRRVESLLSIDSLYRELRRYIPLDSTLNSLESLRKAKAVQNAQPSKKERANRAFKMTFFDFIEYFRKLAVDFKERIYNVLLEFFYDPSFKQLKDLQVKKGGRAKGPAQGLSPDLVKEVGELCRQLSDNVIGLKDTLECWEQLLEESAEIDPSLFDDNSAHTVRRYRDCIFQDLLRLVPDVMSKAQMSVVLATAWWYKAEKIRRKLAANPTSDSGLSSSSEVESSSAACKPPHPKIHKRQKASKDHPIANKPTVFRKKAKSTENIDTIETAPVTQNTQKDPGSKDGRKKLRSLDQSRENNKDPYPDEAGEKTNENKPHDGKIVNKGQSKKTKEGSPVTETDFRMTGGCEETNREVEPRKESDLKVKKKQKGVRPRGDVLKDDKSQQKADQAEDGKELTENDARGKAEKDNKNIATELSYMKPSKKGKNFKNRDAKTKTQRSNVPDNDESGKEPPVRNEKGKSNVNMGVTEDGLEVLSLEQEKEKKGEEPNDQTPLSWQERKLEKLRQKVEELIEDKERQRGSLELLVAMKDNLGKEIAKYRRSYRLKRRLQKRVALLTYKAQGWKEETKLLDYEHQLLTNALRLEMRLNGSFYRFKDVLKERISYLNDMILKQRQGIEELLEELGIMKESTDNIIYYGLSSSDPTLDEFELEFGSFRGYGLGYGSNYGPLGGGLGPMGGLRPYKSHQFLRDEELLLGRSLRNRYERSIWDAPKWDSADSLSMSLMSLEDSFNFPSRFVQRNARVGRGTKEAGRGYQGNDDSSSDEDEAEEE